MPRCPCASQEIESQNLNWKRKNSLTILVWRSGTRSRWIRKVTTLGWDLIHPIGRDQVLDERLHSNRSDPRLFLMPSKWDRVSQYIGELNYLFQTFSIDLSESHFSNMIQN
ncbi:hypothetical protein BpHYR1_044779 [Brachionus plicatilis]|uniref:Uncharacterized protein n=1 Tax=Brachionus plicatilis TaxID=10195 RepID=A0A3M7R8M1_BRAPC|nr:hypothetical protein BpHYR1_044779 [Brachionus plicatilis]